jgi:sodium pump decarboxylase gamma subunit
MWKNIEIGVYLMFIGMGVVFASLYILMKFVNVIGWMERWMKRLFNPIKPPIVAAETTIGAKISPEEIAVIAAAVQAALEKKVEIHHIRMLTSDSQENWSQVGRWDLLHSHNLWKSINK